MVIKEGRVMSQWLEGPTKIEFFKVTKVSVMSNRDWAIGVAEEKKENC